MTTAIVSETIVPNTALQRLVHTEETTSRHLTLASPPPAERAFSLERLSQRLGRPVVRVVEGTLWLAQEAIIRPVKVHCSVEDATVILVEPTTGIFGSGEDLPSAIGDMRAALLEHRDVLEAVEALSPDLEEQLQFLRRHLRPA